MYVNIVFLKKTHIRPSIYYLILAYKRDNVYLLLNTENIFFTNLFDMEK